MISLKCKGCGNPLDLPKEFNDYARCKYCDTVHQLAQQIKISKVVEVVDKNNPTVESLLERAQIQLGNGQFDDAKETYNQVLNISPKEHRAYWGLVLIVLECKNNKDLLKGETIMLTSLKVYSRPISEVCVVKIRNGLIELINPHWQNLLAFSPDCEREKYVNLFESLVEKIQSYLQAQREEYSKHVQSHNEQKTNTYTFLGLIFIAAICALAINGIRFFASSENVGFNLLDLGWQIFLPLIIAAFICTIIIHGLGSNAEIDKGKCTALFLLMLLFVHPIYMASIASSALSDRFLHTSSTEAFLSNWLPGIIFFAVGTAISLVPIFMLSDDMSSYKKDTDWFE